MRAPATLRATLLAILAVTLASCGLQPQEHVDFAKELAKVKGPDTGTIESVLHDQAEQASSAGDYKRAAGVYKQLTDKYPDKVKYQVSFAQNLRRAGENQASLSVSDNILKKEPGNVEALENKGLTLMNTGDFNEAGAVLGQVMKLDPKRWRTLNGIGVLFAMKGKYDASIQYYQAALGVSKDNPSVLNNAALTYAIDHQFDRAYDSFNLAKRHLDPASPDVKHIDLNLALVYAVDGKLDNAEQTAAPHLSKAGLYNNMGFYSYLSKNNEMAKSYLNMALTQSPTYYERAWKNMGALTGDNSGMSGDPQAMPATPDQPASPQAGIQLSDIPESKPLHSEPDSPYAGTDKQPDVTKPAPVAPVTPAAAAPVQPQAKSDVTDNPDVVLLKKPSISPANGDWDSKDNAGAPAAAAPATLSDFKN